MNIPVADLERSKAFFADLGFGFNPNFTDETAACMLVGEHAFVMLLTREKFAEFAKLPMADPTTHALALAPRRSRPPGRTPTPRPDPPPRSGKGPSRRPGRGLLPFFVQLAWAHGSS
ncbi:VOC family protein [Streptomyces sp. T028]|uniref:VOC family protein n=1 Tax=Streptomyces sp. T028 TaxID=3394379 RepID=UPI003A87507A